MRLDLRLSNGRQRVLGEVLNGIAVVNGERRQTGTPALRLSNGRTRALGEGLNTIRSINYQERKQANKSLSSARPLDLR